MSRALRPQPDVLLASTLYLMTRYYAHRCPCVANAVAQHLDLLSQQAEERCSALLRATCAQLELDWRAFTAGLAPADGKHRH
jgi:hypothetical protein